MLGAHLTRYGPPVVRLRWRPQHAHTLPGACEHMLRIPSCWSLVKRLRPGHHPAAPICLPPIHLLATSLPWPSPPCLPPYLRWWMKPSPILSARWRATCLNMSGAKWQRRARASNSMGTGAWARGGGGDVLLLQCFVGGARVMGWCPRLAASALGLHDWKIWTQHQWEHCSHCSEAYHDGCEA